MSADYYMRSPTVRCHKNCLINHHTTSPTYPPFLGFLFVIFPISRGYFGAVCRKHGLSVKIQRAIKLAPPFLFPFPFPDSDSHSDAAPRTSAGSINQRSRPFVAPGVLFLLAWHFKLSAPYLK